ncbi:MAG TPA: TetR/AcrR family transcriptional regulator, partial [Thermomonas sp.]|nr:TetR/AcrR family transcriptional regulator [Thermomonas sp.]
IARAYAESNDSLRKFLSDQYGHVLREFAKALSGCLPGLGKEALYWRLDFLSGALTYAMADFGLIKRPSGVSEATHRTRAAKALIRFAAAGFKADEP